MNEAKRKLSVGEIGKLDTVTVRWTKERVSRPNLRFKRERAVAVGDSIGRWAG